MQRVDDREMIDRHRKRDVMSYNPCKRYNESRDGCIKCTIKATWSRKLCFNPKVVDRVKP